MTYRTYREAMLASIHDACAELRDDAGHIATMMGSVGWQWNDNQPSAEDVADMIDRLRAHLIDHMGDEPRSIACHQWTGGFGYSMEHGVEDGTPWCRCNVCWGLGTHHDGIGYQP